MSPLTQSSHESLGFLSNDISMIFARKIMKKPNPSLEARSKGSIYDQDDLRATQSQR
jgi:hypothetical protein